MKKSIKLKKTSKSMFSVLKGKMKPFTTEERDKIWKDKYREI